MEKKSSIEIREQEKDRLSLLPDDIIVTILSPFSLKFTVSTAVLSQRWRYLWTQIDTLNIGVINCHQSSEISNILNQVIPKLTSSTIRKLQISCDVLRYYKCGMNSIDSRRSFCYRWLNNKTGVLNIEEIEISSNCHRVSQSFLRLPDLSRLKKLTIQFLHFNQLELAEELINSCPSLEDLSLRVFRKGDSPIKLRVRGKRLRRLFVQWDSDGKVVIDAPKLEYVGLEIGLVVTRFSVESNAIALLEADIKKCSNYYNYFDGWFSVSAFLVAISSVRSLAISSPRLGASFKLPYLTHLKLDQKIYVDFNTKTFLQFLSCCPVLENLVFYLRYFKVDDDFVSEFTTPECLLTRIKRIEILSWHTHKPALKLMEYLLGKAQILELLVFKRADRNKQDELSKELKFFKEVCGYQRSSPQCQIEFSGHYLQVSREGVAT